MMKCDSYRGAAAAAKEAQVKDAKNGLIESLLKGKKVQSRNCVREKG